MKSLTYCQLLLPGMFRELAMATSCPPALRTLLRYARRGAVFVGDDYAWRCAFFGVSPQQDSPVAPFAALGDGLSPGVDYWLCADPVHLHLQRDSFTVADGVAHALDIKQARQLVDALNAHFSADGMIFFAPQAGRWYLRLAEKPALQTTPLSEVVGQNIDHLLPRGIDALQWHKQLNEIQMLLHAHSINLDLEQRGLLPVNSLWLWGGGALVPGSARHELAVWGHDPFTTGLSQAHGAAIAPLPFSAEEWLESGKSYAAHLIVLDQLQQAGLREDPREWREALERLERHWFMPLLQALREGAIGKVDLHLAGTRSVPSYAVTRSDLSKFWRRAQPWGAYLG